MKLCLHAICTNYRHYYTPINKTISAPIEGKLKLTEPEYEYLSNTLVCQITLGKITKHKAFITGLLYRCFD